MGLKIKYGKKDDRPLSRKTGYIYYLYLRLKSLEAELLKVMKHMQETELWYDPDKPRALLPPLDNTGD